MPPRWRGESRSSPLRCFVSRRPDLPATDSPRRRRYRRSRTVRPSRATTEVRNLRCGGANDQQARACARPVTPEKRKARRDGIPDAQGRVRAGQTEVKGSSAVLARRRSSRRRSYQTTTAQSTDSGMTARPRYIHVRYAPASLGRMKRFTINHEQTPTPISTRTRSPGVS